MSERKNIVIPADFYGKKIIDITKSAGESLSKGEEIISFEDGSSFVSQENGKILSVSISKGDVCSEKVAFEIEVEENVSSVEMNERTKKLSGMLLSAIASSSIQVLENGRMERKPLAFSIQNEKLTIEDVCSPTGLLSLFVLSASDLFNDAFRRQEGAFPVIYYYEQSALMEVVPYFPSCEEMAAQGVDPNIPDLAFATLAHFMHFALDDYVEKNSAPEMLVDNSIVPLDPLFQKWYEARQSYKVTVYHPTAKQAPTRSAGMSSA